MILPPYTMSGSVAAILFTGATPVFCDIDADNYCLSPKDLSSKVPQDKMFDDSQFVWWLTKLRSIKIGVKRRSEPNGMVNSLER